MSVAQIRTALLKQIDEADERLLRLMYAMTLAYRMPTDQEITDEMILNIPPSSDSKPMTQEELIAELEESNTQFERSEYISLEDLEKEMRKW